MLACVCRPVSSTLPKPPSSTMAPQNRNPGMVVTCEPRFATASFVKVPGRPTAAELRVMALRQQQQISSQHQLLAAKEQRLRFLKAQDARGAAAAAEGERLRRLRERVEAQESKLRRLRALRGQVDLQKTYNVTLSNDLDSIRALFSEKEKELTLAVAKVEALTRQLEDLRKDRRGPLNLISGIATASTTTQTASSTIKNCTNLLVTSSSNSGNSSANNNNGINGKGGVAGAAGSQITTSPTARELDKLRRELMYRSQLSLQQDARLHLQREALQQRQAELRSVDLRILELQNRLQRKKASNLLLAQAQNQNSDQNLNQQQQQQQQQHQQQQQMRHPIFQQQSGNLLKGKPLNNVYPSQRHLSHHHGNNVAAVEPFLHQPQKQISPPLLTKSQTQFISPPSGIQQTMLVQESFKSLTVVSAECDDNKLKKLEEQSKDSSKATTEPKTTTATPEAPKATTNGEESKGDDFLMKKNDPKYQTLPYNTKFGLATTKSSPNIPTSLVNNSSNSSSRANECDSEKIKENEKVKKSSIGVHKPLPSLGANKSPRVHHQIPSGNLAVPPRKPISSVAPTSVTSTASSSSSSALSTTMIPKIVPKMVQMVAPNNSSNSSMIPVSVSDSNSPPSKSIPVPALPPKPNKSPQSSDSENSPSVFKSKSANSIPTIVSVINKSGAVQDESKKSDSSESETPTPVPNSAAEHLPIKAKPLTIKKQPLHEQPKLKAFAGNSTNLKPMYLTRRIEMPPSSFLFPAEKEKTADSRRAEENKGSKDETDKLGEKMEETSLHNKSSSISSVSSVNSDKEKDPPQTNRRNRTLSTGAEKVKLARRVSFDPLALLLDASLEGELELVRKTATQVPNPSAANDEGITALHNAICAGHLEIVKFLVEFGCDVNAQDSDGWTPLHCAASCNNLAMVKFLVESGACLFAATLSDHETPAEKCEEDEEGFDGCSEYLYNIQEKLGIMKSGEVYAVFSYDAHNGDELSFSINDRLTILRKGDDAEREWWWAKNVNGDEGYVPRNLLGLYPRIYRQPLLADSD